MNTNISNFLEGLQHVQAEADKVPDLVRQLAELTAQLAAKTDAATKLEGDLLAEMVKTEGLAKTVSSLEVERDAAGFRADTAEGKLKAIHEVVGPLVVQAQPQPEVASAPVATVEPVTPEAVVPTQPQVIPGFSNAAAIAAQAQDFPTVSLAEPVSSSPVTGSTDASQDAKPLPSASPEVPPARDPYRDSYGHGPSYRSNGTERWNYVEHRWEAVPEAEKPAVSSAYGY